MIFRDQMYVLYLDESGAHKEASCFVLAGLAVFEREIYWFGKDLDGLQKEYFPKLTSSVHFHASKLRVRSGEQVEEPWNTLPPEKRRELRTAIATGKYLIPRERGWF